MIDYPWTRRKEGVERVETDPDTIETFIDIFDRAF